jgi:hypothetical protein
MAIGLANSKTSFFRGFKARVSRVSSKRVAHGELQADEDELLLLADKVPASIRVRSQQRPDLFRKLAKMDKRSLDVLENSVDSVR